MMSSPRNQNPSSLAICPFQVTYWAASAQHDPSFKPETARGIRYPLQQSPFAPDGRFTDGGTLHLRYLVEPRHEWNGLQVHGSVISKSDKEGPVGIK